MNIITTISEKYFELNGIQFAKIYQPLKQGVSAIGIYNTKDNSQQLISSTVFSDFEIDGVTYGTQSETIAALLPVIYLEDAFFDNSVINYNGDQIVNNIVNNPDEEDITESDSVLKLKERDFTDGGQKGYKIIRSGFDWSVIPASYENSILEIRYSFDLTDLNVVIPSNCVLKFKGGLLKNFSSIDLNNCIIESYQNKIIYSTGVIVGMCSNKFVYPEWFGAIGDDLTNDYESFRLSFQASKCVHVSNKTYRIDAYSSLNLTSGFELSGKGTLKFVQKGQRFLYGSNIDNVTIKDISFDMVDATSQGFLGGGYIRFEDSYNIKIENIKILQTSWDGIKFLRCNSFKILNSNINYNVSSAIQIEDCHDFIVENNDLSKNGLNRIDDSYSDLPTGWTGTHVGRGITIFENCYNGLVKGNSVVLNSEYGMRIFSESTVRGCNRIYFDNNYFEDNGHPAGTYGTISLGSDKGIDLLINNSDSVQRTESIRVTNNRFLRSVKNFGASVSLHCYDSVIENNEIIHSGDSKHLLSGVFLYGAYDCIFDGNYQKGMLQAYQVGSQNSTDLVFKNEVAKDIRKFFVGSPLGFNIVSNAYMKHRTDVAVSGDNGFNTTANWNMNDVFIDGFHRGIELNAATFFGRNIRTINTTDTGFRNYGVANSGSRLVQCDFDTINPNEKSNVIYDGNSGQSVVVMCLPFMPTQGYYKTGSFVLNTSYGVDGNNMMIIGWSRITTGTGNVLNTDWKALYVSVVSPST